MAYGFYKDLRIMMAGTRVQIRETRKSHLEFLADAEEAVIAVPRPGGVSLEQLPGVGRYSLTGVRYGCPGTGRLCRCQQLCRTEAGTSGSLTDGPSFATPRNQQVSKQSVIPRQYCKTFAATESPPGASLCQAPQQVLWLTE